MVNTILVAKHRVGLIFFPAFDWCVTPDHPERQERLLYTRDQILEEGLLDIPGIYEFRPFVAGDEYIHRTHICVPNVDKRVSESHRIAIGGTIKAADLVLDNRVDRSFALLRPPGHHAMRIVHGSRGFCTVNNEAIWWNISVIGYTPRLDSHSGYRCSSWRWNPRYFL